MESCYMKTTKYHRSTNNSCEIKIKYRSGLLYACNYLAVCMAGDQCTLFFFCLYPCIRVHGMLDPGPGIEPGPSALEGRVLII